MATPAGFWSYVHADDEAETGRVSKLARDVRAEFELQTGEPIELFLDRDELEWGDRWQERIDTTLDSVAFFVPVLTPRYFQSAECRRELQVFARRATNLGVKELVLPVRYISVPSLGDQNPEDDLVALIQTFQWEDWTDLRFANPDSEEYRRGVARLASRLVEANREAEQAGSRTALEAMPPSEDGGEEPPGILDRLAKAQSTMPEWTDTIEQIGSEITEVGRILSEAVPDIERADQRGKGFAGRIAIMRKVAKELNEPTERLYSLSTTFATQLHAVDDGFRLIIETAPQQIGDNPEIRAQVCQFFDTVRGLTAAASEGLEAIGRMIDAAEPLEAASRDLRPTIRRMRQGLTLTLEAREVAGDWVRRIDESGVDCDADGEPANAG